MSSARTCDHCGRTMGDYAGGSAGLSRDGKHYNLCHPNFSDRPDCYRDVTVWGETIGQPEQRLTGQLSRWMRGDL